MLIQFNLPMPTIISLQAVTCSLANVFCPEVVFPDMFGDIIKEPTKLDHVLELIDRIMLVTLAGVVDFFEHLRFLARFAFDSFDSITTFLCRVEYLAIILLLPPVISWLYIYFAVGIDKHFELLAKSMNELYAAGLDASHSISTTAYAVCMLVFRIGNFVLSILGIDIAPISVTTYGTIVYPVLKFCDAGKEWVRVDCARMTASSRDRALTLCEKGIDIITANIQWFQVLSKPTGGKIQELATAVVYRLHVLSQMGSSEVEEVDRSAHSLSDKLHQLVDRGAFKVQQGTVSAKKEEEFTRDFSKRSVTKLRSPSDRSDHDTTSADFVIVSK